MTGAVQTEKIARSDEDIIKALNGKEKKIDSKGRFRKLFPDLKRLMKEKGLTISDMWNEVKADLDGVKLATFRNWWKKADKAESIS